MWRGNVRARRGLVLAASAMFALASACGDESDDGGGGGKSGNAGDGGSAGSAGAAGSSAGSGMSGAAGSSTGGNAGRGGAGAGGTGNAGTAGSAGMGGADGGDTGMAGEAGMGGAGDGGTAGGGAGGVAGGGAGGAGVAGGGRGGAGMGGAGRGGAGTAGGGAAGAGMGGAGMAGGGAGGAGMAGGGMGGAAGSSGAGGGGGDAPINLYFSEYYEGTATPQQSAVEIFNAGTGNVDLTQCVVRVYQQGGFGFTSVGLLSTLQPDQVYVVCSNQFSASCDRIDSSTMGVVNGDDSVVLLCNGVVQDVIGQPGNDPGTEWGTGVTSTADNVMRRNCNVTIGDRNTNDFFNPVFDWLGAAVTTTDLGFRFCTN